MGGLRKVTRYSCLGAGAILLLIAAVVLRGPHVSNSLKKLILPELELATGQRVIAQKIYINLLPFFIEAKGVKIFDDDGEKVLNASRVKAYIEPAGLLRKELVIQRLVVKDPDITAGQEKVDEIAGSLRKYLSTESDIPLEVSVRAVEIRAGRAQYEDSRQDLFIQTEGLGAEAIIGRTQRIKISSPSVLVRKKGIPQVSAEVTTAFVLRDGIVEIGDLEIGTGGTTLKGAGRYKDGQLQMDTSFDVRAGTVTELFGLKKEDAGRVRGSGKVQYADSSVSVDLTLGGSFYLETLMELLEVEEKVEGLVAFNGHLKGPLRDLQGKASATLTNGNLFQVEIDRVSCNVTYDKGMLRFLDGDGRLYQGRAKASASIPLPNVETFAVNVEVTDVDSPALFRLLGWDPGIHPGKVKGSLVTSGAEFDPEGWFEYRNDHPKTGMLDRIQHISGRYSLRGQRLSLTELKLAAAKSRLMADGLVDIGAETLDIRVGLETDDLSELLSPFTADIRGRGAFSGKIAGTFKDPRLDGSVKIHAPVLKGFAADSIDAELSYRKDLLDIRQFNLAGADAQMTLRGSIAFPAAKDLFDLADPRFTMQASIRNADLSRTGPLFMEGLRAGGKGSAELKIEGNGDAPRISGEAKLVAFSVYDVAFDTASLDIAYSEKTLRVSRVMVRKGKSVFSGEAALLPGGSFSYRASTEKCFLSDLVPRPLQGEAAFALKSEGRGTFSNPVLSLDGRMIEGTLRGKPVGSGTVSASVRDREIRVEADLLDGKIRARGGGRFEGDIPWNAKVEIQTSRYDFLISSLLKDVPEDFIFSLSGRIEMKGDRRHVSASAVFGNVVLSLYGYTFTNDEEIRVELRDRQIHSDLISLRSGNTFIHLNGDLVVGKKYDLTLKGKSALAPFKSMFSKVGLLRGDAEFEIAVSGEWEDPHVNGWLKLENGSFGHKDYPHRISALNGYLSMDNDRVILQKLTGKTGGGDITITGILYLKKFAFKRFYVEGRMDNITMALTNDFSVRFSGSLLYRGTPAAQSVSGDLAIHNARYRERVEWKSWLLKAKKAERIKADISNLEKATLNIRIAGDNTIQIDNNVARATMSADMIVRGTLYHPVLFGRLESKEGTVYFRNNEFNILHASADFADPHRINPVMEVLAETIVKSYKIKMNLEGQMDHFNMSLSSDPPLKEMDILALLTVGQTGGELKGLEGGIGAGEATSFVTGKIQDVLEERLKTVTGLDRLQIDPYVSRSTGTVEPRVTVSKRLMGDKMFVTYTTSLGTTEEQIVKLEYFLSKNISLVGMRDERGIVGGDVRFRFEFK